MPEAQSDTTYVKNIFGLVTDKRVVFHPHRGWLREGWEEDVPLGHVASVRLETSRNLIGGIVLVLFGVPAMMILVGVIFILFGVCLLWGSPTVVIDTTDGNQSVMKGWPWHRGLAEEFVKALQDQIAKG